MNNTVAMNNIKFFSGVNQANATHYVIVNNDDSVAYMSQKNFGRKISKPKLINTGDVSMSAVMMSLVASLIKENENCGFLQIHATTDVAIRYREFISYYKETQDKDELFQNLQKDWMEEDELLALSEFVDALCDYDREQMAVIVNERASLKFVNCEIEEGYEIEEGTKVTFSKGICSLEGITARVKSGSFVVVKNFKDEIQLKRINPSKFYSLMQRIMNALQKLTPVTQELNAILSELENSSPSEKFDKYTA